MCPLNVSTPNFTEKTKGLKDQIGPKAIIGDEFNTPL